MNNIIFFADNNVGLNCISFVIKNYEDDVKYIVVTNTSSVVYKYLIDIKFNQKKILFTKDFLNIEHSKIDYIFLLWWPYLINKDIISLATYGVINTHPSLLPYNRGKNYNFWNIVEDFPFGVTLHFVDSSIDGGDIIFQKTIKKSWECTGGTLYTRAQLEMTQLFIASYKKILEHKYERQQQNLSNGSYHNSNELEKASEIFLDKSYKAKELLNLLRARTFKPYNGCYFYDENNKYEIEINIKRIKN